MAIIFFYGSIAGVLILFFICTAKRPLTFSSAMIAITGMGVSLLYEVSLGEYLDLYYYIKPEKSLFYIILSAVLLYPVLEVIYTLFLPDKMSSKLVYTFVWTILMLIFEILSLYTKTIVFTGWRMIPWSLLTYIFTYIWINLLLREFKKRGL